MKAIRYYPLTIPKIRFTQQGYDNLLSEIDKYTEQRKKAVIELQKAREMGDLSENGYYKEAKARLSFIDSRLRKLNKDKFAAVVVQNNEFGTIDIGSKVKIKLLKDGSSRLIELVGDVESNPIEGKISLLSPLGKALKGKKLSDTFTLNLPAGEFAYLIEEVS